MQTFWDNVLRVVAVIGLIAVLLLGAWGIIQLAFMLPTFFHNIGSRTPAPVQETAIKPATTTTIITPVVEKPAAPKPTTVVKPTTKVATKTSTQGGTYYPSGRTANLSGYPDLAVRITSANSQNGNATVQFIVENVGTNVVGAGWSLNAMLPIQGSYTYPVGNQQALYPGDRIVCTLRYADDNSSASGAGLPAQAGNPCNGWSFPCTPPVTYGGPTSCNQYGPCAVPGYSSYNNVYNQYTYGSQEIGRAHV